MKLSELLKKEIPNINLSDLDTYKKTVDKLLCLVGDEKEKELIAKFIAKTIDTDTDRIVLEVKILCMRVQLNEYKDIIPFSYIAKHYFKKSKAWLSQRINGYDVNRKESSFTEKELEIFNFALKDISNKIGSITLL